IFRKAGWNADADAAAVAIRRHRVHKTQSIDMTVDEMTAQLVADPERKFEVDARALFPLSKGRAEERFGHGLHRPPRTAGTFAELHECQASAGVLDRGAHLQGRHRVLALDGETANAVRVFELGDTPDVRDQSGKHHQCPLMSEATPRASPSPLWGGAQGWGAVQRSRSRR